MSQPGAPHVEMRVSTGAQRSAVDASGGASDAARMAILEGVDSLASVVQRAPGVSIEHLEPGAADDAYRQTSGRVLARRADERAG